MNRLNNALKQRDAAREDALLHANKLTKLQVLLLATDWGPLWLRW